MLSMAVAMLSASSSFNAARKVGSEIRHHDDFK
jgi:hypothetical protein